VSTIEPHLWTDHFIRAVDWYRSVLGFDVAAWFPDEEDATWCQLRRGEVSVMIAVTPDPAALAPNQGYLATVGERVDGTGAPMSLYLHVEEADAMYERATNAGAQVIEDIWDAWWGGRQFTLADPDGTWWTVFQSSEVTDA
jgi:uncharacterized glyoxalase superfamily protein PhnB